MMMLSFLTEPQDGTIEVNATTDLENVSATIEIKPMLSMFDQEKDFQQEQLIR